MEFWELFTKPRKDKPSDPTYRRNRQSAKDAGLLWGAYHFGTGSDGLKQAQHFLAVVGNEPGTLLAPSTSSRTPQGQAWTSRRRARSSPASTRKRGGSRAFTRGTTSSSCWGPAPIRCSGMLVLARAIWSDPGGSKELEDLDDVAIYRRRSGAQIGRAHV